MYLVILGRNRSITSLPDRRLWSKEIIMHKCSDSCTRSDTWNYDRQNDRQINRQINRPISRPTNRPTDGYEGHREVSLGDILTCWLTDFCLWSVDLVCLGFLFWIIISLFHFDEILKPGRIVFLNVHLVSRFAPSFCFLLLCHSFPTQKNCMSILQKIWLTGIITKNYQMIYWNNVVWIRFKFCPKRTSIKKRKKKRHRPHGHHISSGRPGQTRRGHALVFILLTWFTVRIKNELRS